MIVYGSMQCPDCVECKEAYDAQQIAYEFRDIDKNLAFLKEFLVLRDHQSVFLPVKENGSIGIPCIIMDDGSVCLDWEVMLL